MPVSQPRRYESHQKYTPSLTRQIERDKQELFLELISLDYRPQQYYSQKEAQYGIQDGVQYGVQSEEDTALVQQPIYLKSDPGWSPQQYSTMMRTWADTSEIYKPDELGTIQAINGVASKSVISTKLGEPSMIKSDVAQKNRRNEQSGQVKSKEEVKFKQETIPSKIAVIKVQSTLVPPTVPHTVPHTVPPTVPPTLPPTVLGPSRGVIRATVVDWKVPEEQSEQSQQNIFSRIAPIENREAPKIDSIRQEFQSYSSIFKSKTVVTDKPQQERNFVKIKVPRKPAQPLRVPQLSSSEDESLQNKLTKPLSSIASSSSGLQEHTHIQLNKRQEEDHHSLGLISVIKSKLVSLFKDEEEEEINSMQVEESSNPRRSSQSKWNVESKQSQSSLQKVKINAAEVKKMNNIVNESVKIVSVNLSKIVKKEVPKIQVSSEERESRDSSKQSSQMSNIQSYSQTVPPQSGNQSVKESYSEKNVLKKSESGYSQKARQKLPIQIKIVKVQQNKLEGGGQQKKQEVNKEINKKIDEKLFEPQRLERVAPAPLLPDRHLFKYDDLKEVQYSSDAISLSNIPSCSSSSRSVEAHAVSPLSVPTTFKDEDFDLDEVKDYSSSSEEDEQPHKLNVRVAQVKKKIVLQSVLQEDLEESHYSPRKTPRIINHDIQQLEQEFLSQADNQLPLKSHRSDQPKTTFVDIKPKSEEQTVLEDVKTDIGNLVAKMQSQVSVKSMKSMRSVKSVSIIAHDNAHDKRDSAFGSDGTSKKSFQVPYLKADSAISSQKRENILQEFDLMNSKVSPLEISLDLRRLATRIAAEAPQH